MANITEEAKDTKPPSKYLIMTDENTSWMMPVSHATCRHILRLLDCMQLQSELYFYRPQRSCG